MKSKWGIMAPTSAHAEMGKMWLIGATAALTGKIDIWTEENAIYVEGAPEAVQQAASAFKKWLSGKGVEILDITNAADC